jgi:hypothetical protein
MSTRNVLIAGALLGLLALCACAAWVGGSLFIDTTRTILGLRCQRGPWSKPEEMVVTTSQPGINIHVSQLRHDNECSPSVEFIGVLENTSDQPLMAQNLAIFLHDADGQVVARTRDFLGNGLFYADVILPGERVPFKVYVWDVDPNVRERRLWTATEVSLLAYVSDTNDLNPPPFTVVSSTMQVSDQFGTVTAAVGNFYIISATIRNAGTRERYANVIVGLYDAQGQLLDVDTTRPDQPLVASGVEATIQAEFHWSGLPVDKPARYEFSFRR